jgi:hypothetical protein
MFMKTLIALIACAVIGLPFAACTDVHSRETTHSNWDGSTTHETTTVRENNLTGGVSVDKEKTTTH